MTKATAVIHYTAATTIFAKWLGDGLISLDEYSKIDEIVATKYGLSSCSIYRRNRLTYGGPRAIMLMERGPLCDQNN